MFKIVSFVVAILKYFNSPRIILTPLLCGMFFPTSSAAESSRKPELIEPEVEAEDSAVELYITPNRYLTSREEIGSSFSVVTKEDIQVRKQPGVLEALQTLPSVEVFRSGGSGTTASVLIRGADSDQTLVLIDGVRVNLNSTGGYDFTNLKAEEIERIEVIRGPQSVLYGSEAIGGVVNIITAKAAPGLSGSLRAMGGSFGTQEYRAGVSRGGESSHASLTASFLKTDGYSAASEDAGNVENDGHQNLSLSGRAGATVLDNAELELTFRYSDAEVEADGFDFALGAVDDLNFEQDNRFFVSSLTFTKPLTEWLKANASIGLNRDELEGKDPDTDFNNFEIDNRSETVTSSVEVYPPWEGVFLLGYTVDHRKTENKGVFEKSRTIHSVFSQKQISFFEQLTVSAGVRYDDDSDFGNETTFRTALSFNISETGTRLHSSFGTGFKAPSFNELYFPDFGNPDLDAETSWGYDVGIEQAFLVRKIIADITFFQTNIDDLIGFDSVTFLASNIDEAEIRGLENKH